MKIPVTGFEHLHRHTSFSLLDGLGDPEEYAWRSKEINQHYLCISDHGMMGAVPRQLRACEAMHNKFNYELHPIYAIELYLQNKHASKEDMGKMAPEERIDDLGNPLKKSYHLLAIAYNQIGYSNLVKLSSWGWLNGYYYRPRVNYEQLKKHKEGVIFTSCCYNGEIGQAFDKGGSELAYQMLEKYLEMFGENFYLELMLLDFKKQKPFDAWLIEAHDKYHIPLILTQDCHYVYKEHSKFQRYMLMIQTGRTLNDLKSQGENVGEDGENFFELQDKNLWMKSEEELNEKWISDYSEIIPLELFQQAKANTITICEKAKGVEIDRSVKLPQIPDANEKLKEKAIEGFRWRGFAGKAKYAVRLKEEYDLITRKGFASYFLIQQEIIEEARRICPELLGWGKGDEAAGPGRGSCCGSLMCYCLGITDVDPIKHDLLFSRFLSESRGGRVMKVRFSDIPFPED